MLKYILLLAVVTAAVRAYQAPCRYDTLTCEWKYLQFPWVNICPDDTEARVHAFWGRDTDDNTTCVDEVPPGNLQDLDCPDQGDYSDNAITDWCNDPANIRTNGDCKIRAANPKVGGDPCVNTFKYLRTCTYCRPTTTPPCDPENDANSQLTCEWKYARFPWAACPAEHVRKARARWGRMDNTTCVDEVDYMFLQDLNCPGNEEAASQAVTAWCNDPANIRGNGDCKIRASNPKVGGDPCVETFKYLQTCTYCDWAPHEAEPQVLVLLDSTGSMMSQSTSYMPKVIEFLDAFFAFTSTDTFWAGYHTNLKVVPFTDALDLQDAWLLNYGDYSSAATLRDDESHGLNVFRNDILARLPTALTNLGQVLEDVRDHHHAGKLKMVILVSDFINIKTSPDLITAANNLKGDGVHIFPVLLEKPINDWNIYESVDNASDDQLGLDIATEAGIPDSVMQSWFDATSP